MADHGKDHGGSRVNLPNLLTLVRIVLTPLMVIFMIQGRLRDAALVFLVAGVSDGLDGLLARWLRQKTVIGAILDPLADKLLLSSSYVTLAVLGELPPWLTVVVISRDVIILVGVLVLFILHGHVDIHPSLPGKVTTFTQLATVLAVFLNHGTGWMEPYLTPLFFSTGAATIISGLHYMTIGVGMLGNE